MMRPVAASSRGRSHTGVGCRATAGEEVEMVRVNNSCCLQALPLHGAEWGSGRLGRNVG